MLTNRGYGRDDVDVIGGRGAALSATGSDLVDKLSQLGLADTEQEDYVDGIGRGGTVIAARTADERRADQLTELMREHGATHCTHMPAKQ